MKPVRLNILIFALFSTFGYSQTAFAKFPTKSALLSPDRSHVLRSVDNAEDHSIFLTDKSTGLTRKVYDYGRGATVIWSPDNRRFALNDYAGSNISEIYIIATDQRTPQLDVGEEIRLKAKDLARGDHEYFGIARWLDGQHVIVHHWGHGDGQAFCQCYIYKLGGPVMKCAKQIRGSDPEEQCGRTTP
jgi:hypothetical protein